MTNEEIVQKINEAEHSLIAVTWKGKPVFVKVKELSDLQIQAIGNFSLIGSEVISPIKDWREIEITLELQHNIVKASLVSPTYSEIFEIAQNKDFVQDVERKFVELNKEIIGMQRGPEKSAAEQKIASLRILFDLVLPNDFTSKIVSYVLGVGKTDINLVTKGILLNCAVLQKRSGGRPSDYCDGKLSPFNKRDIDTNAYAEYDDYIRTERMKAGNR